jgi:hypothetical protein
VVGIIGGAEAARSRYAVGSIASHPSAKGAQETGAPFSWWDREKARRIISGTMRQPIKLRGRFATPYDIAETLGVSAARTRQLIEMARKHTRGMIDRNTESGSFVARKKKTGSRASAVGMKKSNGRQAHAAKNKAHTRTTKAHR